ncbi:hypothetical protein BBI17_003802 [Phytophthora kernoviae]|uniref:Uncharacterized protein n=1 Tax=Phytophthora kernoviae TaxID=325452 RepID=A0A3R7HBZ6_9STRA|nr:hypothetical protein BBI17_003802 [Phytophthora kernoviae]
MSDDGARLMTRYVRPIYDAIDGRQYKTAIKLCGHKRVAHLDIVQVLKAHCLERTGRVDEALDICRRVQSHKPTDDTLLNTMNLVFKLSDCEHEMLPTFEHACAVSNPPNEELFQSLFVAYARRGDFLKQQQTALKMFKAFGNIKYVCWAALSMMLQVEHGGTPARMLALAEKMLLKTLRDSGSGDGEALRLTVLMMQLQDKHADALQAFDEFVKPGTDKKEKKSKKQIIGRALEGEGMYDEEIELGPMQAIDRLSLEATLVKNVSNWKRCAAVNRKLLEEYNADDWTFLKEYIAAQFEEQPERSGDELLALGQELTDFLNELQSRPGNERIRGPALATIHVTSEILRRLSSASTSQVERIETKLQDLIIGYTDRFYSKACCFTDLKQYFTLYLKDSSSVSASAKTKLTKHFYNMSEESKSLLKKTPDGQEIDEKARKEGLGDLNRHLLALKTLRFLGYYENVDLYAVEDLEKLVKELEDEYEATSWLNDGGAGGQREVQHTDDLLLLATHFLLDIYQQSSGHRGYLERAAALLEYGLEKSAYNFQMKLLLSRIYGYLGAAEAMLSRHAELDVKYVQLDSLTFLVLDKMLNLCQYPEAQKLTDRIAALHRSTAKDTPDYITRSYRLGVYSKVIDMSSFLHKRMKKSHTLAITKGETLQFKLLDVLAHGPTKLHEFVISTSVADEISSLDSMLVADGSQLSHNQHREVIVDWTSKQQIPTGDLFAQDVAPLVECDRSADASSSLLWLKLRVLVPKLLRSLATDDETALEGCMKEYDEYLTQLHLTGSSPAESHVHHKLWKWSSEAIAASGQIVSAVNGNESDSSSAITSLQDDFTAIVAQLRTGLVFASASSSDGVVALSPYGVSTLSALLLDCGLSSLSALALAQRALSKKKGKKSEQLVATANALRNLLKHMQEELNALEMYIADLQFASTTASDATSSARDEAQEKARNNVVNSYKSLQLRLVELLRDRCSSILSDVAWSPMEPSLLATCSADAKTLLWDMRSPQRPVQTLNAYNTSVTQLEWNRVDSTSLATAHDGEVRVWDLRAAGEKAVAPAALITAHMQKIYGLDWHPQRMYELVTCSEDKTVKFWDVTQPRICQVNAELVHSFSGHGDLVKGMAWRVRPQSSVYQLVSWSKDQELRLWHVDVPQLEACGYDTASYLADVAPSEGVNTSARQVNTRSQLHAEFAEIHAQHSNYSLSALKTDFVPLVVPKTAVPLGTDEYTLDGNHNSLQALLALEDELIKGGEHQTQSATGEDENAVASAEEKDDTLAEGSTGAKERAASFSGARALPCPRISGAAFSGPNMLLVFDSRVAIGQSRSSAVPTAVAAGKESKPKAAPNKLPRTYEELLDLRDSRFATKKNKKPPVKMLSSANMLGSMDVGTNDWTGQQQEMIDNGVIVGAFGDDADSHSGAAHGYRHSSMFYSSGNGGTGNNDLSGGGMNELDPSIHAGSEYLNTYFSSAEYHLPVNNPDHLLSMPASAVPGLNISPRTPAVRTTTAERMKRVEQAAPALNLDLSISVTILDLSKLCGVSSILTYQTDLAPRNKTPPIVSPKSNMLAKRKRAPEVELPIYKNGSHCSSTSLRLQTSHPWSAHPLGKRLVHKILDIREEEVDANDRVLLELNFRSANDEKCLLSSLPEDEARYDVYKEAYAEVLYRYGAMNLRNEVLKTVSHNVQDQRGISLGLICGSCNSRFIKGKAHKSKSDAKSKKKVIIHKAQRRREYEKVKKREGSNTEANSGSSSFYDKFFSELKSGKVDEDAEEVEQAEKKPREKGERQHAAKPDPFYKAKKKAAVTKLEKQRVREEKQKRVAESEKKVTQRKKRHVKLSQRTVRGQPVVRNHINDILSRLQAEKKKEDK